MPPALPSSRPAPACLLLLRPLPVSAKCVSYRDRVGSPRRREQERRERLTAAQAALAETLIRGVASDTWHSLKPSKKIAGAGSIHPAQAATPASSSPAAASNGCPAYA